jgi:uncharacterized protein
MCTLEGTKGILAITQRIRFVVFSWAVFLIGLIIMSFGIALMIRANLGSAPWDVLNIGLYRHFGLTVGTWSIIIGILIVGSTSLLTKTLPKAGAVANMILVGIFIDFFLNHFGTPQTIVGRGLMLLLGILVNGVGTSVYISARIGAGPRDSLMLYLVEKMGMKLTHVRRIMEAIVLVIGWSLGGPVNVGTLTYVFLIGSIVGRSLPLCEKWVEKWIERSGWNENFNQGQIRAHDHDGAQPTLREGAACLKNDREGA